MKSFRFVKYPLLICLLLILMTSVFAGSPLWTFTPLTATTLTVPADSTATIQYQITNQSRKLHTLSMRAIPGITQLTTGFGICGNPFVLNAQASCVLSLQVNGSQIASTITDGPIVCEGNSMLQCYRPSQQNILRITKTPANPLANISISGPSTLTLTTNGPTGSIIILNNSLAVTALNIASDFTGTALDGNVMETGNTCAVLLPSASCTLTYTPGSVAVPQTSFIIQGSNTNALTAAIQIDESVQLDTVSPNSGTASGGTGVTLSGSGFTGATSVTFDGVSATSVNVVSSTTVTAVTPAHAIGAVDVTITTPSGSSTLPAGYTYVTTAVGQSAFGGTIACLNGGLNNLIAAVADNSSAISWGATGITTGATSITDGASNTATIVSTPGQPVPNAASICDAYEVDSQGNAPCIAGNTCYNDWFLPAGNNLTASGQLNCLFTNRVAIGGFAASPYWSSTESNLNSAFIQSFISGAQISVIKTSSAVHVRCVRSFTP